MNAYIFMNHHIRKPDNKEPVITIQHGELRIYANHVKIDGPSEVYSGQLLEVDTHVVKAWIECDFDDVVIVE